MSWLLAKGAFGLMPIPNVVIIGRPNVGKSSLLNWIAGRRVAIVDDMSGVTRDRVGTLAQVSTEPDSRFFEVIDTWRVIGRRSIATTPGASPEIRKNADR